MIQNAFALRYLIFHQCINVDIMAKSDVLKLHMRIKEFMLLMKPSSSVLVEPSSFDAMNACKVGMKKSVRRCHKKPRGGFGW